jgi:RNA polymerase sigma-70 factor, ECF subfamily
LTPSPSPTDGTSPSLLVRVRANEAGAWERLVDLYAPLVYHWCRRCRLPPEDAADVFQEVFRAVAEHLGGFRRDRPGDSFRAWLRTITRSKVRDHVRRQAGQAQAPGGTDAQRLLHEVPAPELDEEDPGEANLVIQQVRRVLGLIRGEFDSRRVDRRADVYALGCTLYFLLAGKPPYEEPTPLETLLAHRERAIPSVRATRPDCPPALDALVRAMLAKRPEDRPPDMDAAIAGLEAAAAEVAPADPARPRRRKRQFLAAGAALAAVVVAAVGAMRPWDRGPSPRPAGDPPGEMATVLPPAAEGPQPRIVPAPAPRSAPSRARTGAVSWAFGTATSC